MLSKNKNYYCSLYKRVNGRQVNKRLHSLLMGSPPFPGWVVDHINHDTMDNRRCNLRWVSPSASSCHQQKKRTWNGRPTTSKYIGVCWRNDGRKWKVSVTRTVNGVRTRKVACFANEREAAMASDVFRLELQGEYAVLNFPEKLEEYKQTLKPRDETSENQIRGGKP
jgi:hypothetical protein